MKEMRIMRAIGEIDDAYIDEAAPPEKKKALRFTAFTKYAGIAAAAVLVAGVGIFALTRNTGIDVNVPSQTAPSALTTTAAEPAETTDEIPDLAQAVSPFEDYDTLEEAVKASGIKMSVPDSVGGFTDRRVSVIFGDLIDVTYLNSSGEDEYVIRKAKGTDDPSGDYNDYAETKEAAVGGNTVTLKGNGGKISLAVWTDGTYAYSVMTVNSGIAQEEMEEIIKNVK